jgi:hypothetical protein
MCLWYSLLILVWAYAVADDVLIPNLIIWQYLWGVSNTPDHIFKALLLFFFVWPYVHANNARNKYLFSEI